MAKSKLESFEEIGNHYDRIFATNSSMTEDQILKIIADSTGTTVSTIRKRWNFMQGVDWPIIDYVERGVIGFNRAIVLAEADLSHEEKNKVMDKSLDDNVADADFKDWLTRYMEIREKGGVEDKKQQHTGKKRH